MTARIAACAALVAVLTPQGVRTKMQGTEEFRTTIATIGTEVKTLEVTDELFAVKKFVQIYENPEPYLDPAIALMGRRDVGTHEKTIIGYAMQRLPLEPYLLFASAALDSVSQDVSSSAVLESALFPALNWGKQNLIVNYDKPATQTFLHRVLNAPKTPEKDKAYVRNRILTGAAKQDYKQFKEVGAY